MKQLTLLILLNAAAFIHAESPSHAPLNVVPRPVAIKALTGTFRLNDLTRIVAGDKEPRRIAVLFNDYLLNQHGFNLKIFTAVPKGVPYISFSQAGTSQMPAEGYRLVIGTEGIRIVGKPAGLFYGMQTLTQLLPLDIEQSIDLPAVEITDYPRFTYRGALLDVGRHYFSVAVLKRYLDLLAQYKINTFHWHLTDDQGWRIEIKKYPRLTEIGSRPPQPGNEVSYGGYYTQDQIRDIVAYARDRFITIVPEIEMPGHSQAALTAYPELACAPPSNIAITDFRSGVFCPKKETFSFLEDVLSEVINLFPGPYVHIGGDEVSKDEWKQSSEAQAIMQREGLKDEDELQSYFVRHVERFLTSKGKRTIGWDEILQGGLAPNAIVMSWRGEAGGIAAVKQRHQAIMSPTDYCYLDYNQGDPKYEPPSIGGYLTLPKVYSYDPVPTELGQNGPKYILGVQANVWTEYISTPEHLDYMVFPRLLALAEVAWSPLTAKDYADFRRRLPYQLGRLDKQDINYRIPEPDGLKDFFTATDDHFLVNLVPVTQGSQVYYTLDGSLPTDQCTRYKIPIQIPLRENQKTTLNLVVVTPKGRRSAVYDATFVRRSYLDVSSYTANQPGLAYRLFEGKFVTTKDIDEGIPISTGTADSFDLQQFGRTVNYGVQFDGYLKAPADSFYEFAVESDDGAVLQIDDEIVVDNDGNHASRMVNGHIPLRQGFHKMQLRYYQAEGGAALRVSWAASGKELVPLEKDALFH